MEVLNDISIQRNIFLAHATNANSPLNIPVGYTQVVSTSQTPQNSFGNTILGDYELKFILESPYSFPGGTLVIAFSGGTNDPNCDGSLSLTSYTDASNNFLCRFYYETSLSSSLSYVDNADIGGYKITSGLCSTLTASISSQTNVACNGGTSGSATVVASGGTGFPETGPNILSSMLSASGSGTTFAFPQVDNVVSIIIYEAAYAGAANTQYNFTNGTDVHQFLSYPTTSGQTITVNTPNPMSFNQVTMWAWWNNAYSTSIQFVTASGYTYLWSPGGATTATANNLTANTYMVTVTDANGCTETVSATITQPTAISLTAASQTNVSCFGGSNGAAAVNAATGGAGGYSYNWTPGNPAGDGTTSVTGLSAGTYTVTVTDANACTASQSFTVTQPTAPVSGTTVVTNVSCFSGSNGAINLTPNGGTGPYTYNWLPSGPTTEDRTGLVSGTYQVQITDNNGCTGTVSATVTQSSAISLTAASQTNIACFGGSNGAAAVNVATGGAGGYSYNWTPGNPTGDGTTSVTGLSAGTWTCTVTDANGCTASQSFTLTEPTAISLTAASQTNVSCFGGSNGALEVNAATGGTPGYTYDWSPGTPTGDGTTSINGISAGTYTVTVTDANACTASVIFTVTQPSATVSGTTVTTNVACNGGSNGTINLTPTGGTSGYTFDWGGGITTEDRTGLVAGTYSVTITDVNGCTGIVSTTVSEPTALSTSVSSTNSDCGGSNGSASVLASGGTTNYTYLWSNAGITSSISGIPSGVYNVTVTDANGCTATNSVTVSNNPDITAPAAPTLATITAECTATASAPTASDNCAGMVTGTTIDPLTYSSEGTYTINWTFDDGNGNTSTATQTVIIDDVTVPVTPVLTVLNGDCSLNIISPTTTDNCAGTITGTTTDPTSFAGPGTYSINWTFDDGNGNSTSAVQTVNITDANSPMPLVAVLADVNGQCSVDNAPAAPTAFDNCAGIITGTTNATFPINTQGTTIITWTFDDGNGNIATQTQNIVVNDNTAPVANTSTLADLNGFCSVNMPTAPTATDNCSGTISGTTNTSFPITTPGTTVVTWTFTDANGNVSTQTQNAIVSGVDVSTSVSGAEIIASNTAGTYQWINCGNNTLIANETSQSYTAIQNGSYAVIVTENGCVDTSDCVQITTVGLDDMNLEDLVVYPNPSASGKFQIKYEGKISNIEARDLSGRVIQLNFEDTGKMIDASALAPGKYILMITTEQSVVVKEIVLIH